MTGQPFYFDVRPTSYWGRDDDPRVRLHRVKGQDRRRSAEALLRGGEADELASPEFDESLPDRDRDFRGGMHPSLMSGEYLPDFEGDELEIARVTLASVTGDVISIRARREDHCIRYRIVDEYEGDTVYRCQPADSTRPLTMRELVGLIDSAHGEGLYPDYGTGLTTVWRDFHVDNGSSPAEMVRFVSVSSEFYPDLRGYYDAEAAAWLENHLTKYGSSERNHENADNSDEQGDHRVSSEQMRGPVSW